MPRCQFEAEEGAAEQPHKRHAVNSTAPALSSTLRARIAQANGLHARAFPTETGRPLFLDRLGGHPQPAFRPT
eukprot:5803440-Alexandrium_andersonii.AAC.1